MTKRLFVETDDWTVHDHDMATSLRKMPHWGMITSSHVILLAVDYERPSRTRIIKEPLEKDQPYGLYNNINLQPARPRLERMRAGRLLQTAISGLLPQRRVQG